MAHPKTTKNPVSKTVSKPAVTKSVLDPDMQSLLDSGLSRRYVIQIVNPETNEILDNYNIVLQRFKTGNIGYYGSGVLFLSDHQMSVNHLLNIKS